MGDATRRGPDRRGGGRRKAREMALQALYAVDITDAWEEQPPRPELFYEADRWPESVPFAASLLSGVLAHRKTLDEAIETVAEHWTVARMNVVERNILRISAYEILFREEIPPKVSINEGIELAKRFGRLETRGFLNGILDKIAGKAGRKEAR